MAHQGIQWDKLFGKLIIISIPLMIICLACNITMRMGDTYQYNLSASEVLNSAPVVVSEEKVVNTFQDYMQYKIKDFTLLEEVDYEPKDVFNDTDKKAMYNLRMTLNIMLLIGILMLLITAVSYFFLIRWRKKYIHMRCFKKSFWIFVLLSIIFSLTTAVPELRALTWGHMFGNKFSSDDLLVMIFEKNFALQVTVFDLIISFVLMAVLAYATWEAAGRKKMFRRR